MKTYQITEELLHLNVSDEDYSQKRMKLMVQYLQRYLDTYDKQSGYENYTDSTFINDVLYGLGVVINPEQHQYADGFDRWKIQLIKFLSD